MNATAALMLSGFLFASAAWLAPNDGRKPAPSVAASENGSSVTRPQDTQAIPVFKITPLGSKINFDVEASVAIAGTFDKWDATLTLRPQMSVQAFWTSRFKQTASIPEAA